MFKRKHISHSILLICLWVITFLQGCASSNVSRNTAANVDLGVRNAKNLVSGATSGDIVESYQTANQTVKGAVIGGAAGTLVGMMSSGIGIFPGAATGALLGASYGGYIDSHTTLEDRLENRGATMVILGDQILIVLPSARIFQPMTATLKPQAYSTLALVARFINRYTKILVKISVYTNASGSPDGDLALSTAQAKAVARFLEASGVNARILYALGCGGKRLVNSRALEWEANENYRIEITFEKLYV